MPQIYVEDTLADPSRYCWLTLYDGQDRITDRMLLTFYTNSTVFDTKPTGGLNGTGDGAGEAKLPRTSCGGSTSQRVNVGVPVMAEGPSLFHKQLLVRGLAGKANDTFSGPWYQVP